MKKNDENIEHPKHYNQGEFEVIDVIWDWGWGPDFCLGNAIKYIARAEHKGRLKEDLKKARWCLDFYIQKLEDDGEA